MKTKINKSVIQKTYFEPVTILHLASFMLLFYLLYEWNARTYAFWFEHNPTLWQVYSSIVQINATSLMVGVNLFFLVCYIFAFKGIEKYKVNNLEWPWIENPKMWRKIWPDCVKTYLINQIVIFPPFFLLITWLFSTETSIERIPSAPLVFAQVIISTLLEDFIFYFMHRLLHHPKLYSKVHKKHHSFYNVFHMSAVYAHWLEFIIANLMPLFAGAILLGPKMHMVSLVTFIMFRMIETHETHSGYEFPWSPFKILPFSTDSAYHNYHHLKNIGNYSSFFMTWDSIFQTNKNYFKELQTTGADGEASAKPNN
jgi:4-alpha-methyl-delta7-sterol-4alpha-methyl oxidase